MQPFQEFHYAHFFSARPGSHVQKELEGLPAFPPAIRHCLIAGPERSAKTSILFHYAVALARNGERPLFICHRAKLEQVPPMCPPNLSLDDSALERINLRCESGAGELVSLALRLLAPNRLGTAARYLESGQDLVRFAACIHLMAQPPNAILVDDLHKFVPLRTSGRDHDRELPRLLAFLHEAAMSVSPSCPLVVSAAYGAEGVQPMYILTRWFPLILKIEDVAGSCLSRLHFSCADLQTVYIERIETSQPDL